MLCVSVVVPLKGWGLNVLPPNKPKKPHLLFKLNYFLIEGGVVSSFAIFRQVSAMADAYGYLTHLLSIYTTHVCQIVQ